MEFFFYVHVIHGDAAKIKQQLFAIFDTKYKALFSSGPETPVLEAHCPTCFRCFHASTHLIQVIELLPQHVSRF